MLRPVLLGIVLVVAASSAACGDDQTPPNSASATSTRPSSPPSSAPTGGPVQFEFGGVKYTISTTCAAPEAKIPATAENPTDEPIEWHPYAHAIDPDTGEEVLFTSFTGHPQTPPGTIPPMLMFLDPGVHNGSIAVPAEPGRYEYIGFAMGRAAFEIVVSDKCAA